MLGARGVAPERSRQMVLRTSENWEPVDEVQFSWLGVASAQLTLEVVLRTSEVISISTRLGLIWV